MTTSPQLATPQILQGKCHQCQTLLEIAFPPIVCLQDVTVGVVAVPHVQGINCPNCNVYHAVFIASAQINLALVLAEKPSLNEDKKIIPFSIIPKIM